MLYENLHGLDRAQHQAKDKLVQKVVKLRGEIECLQSDVAILRSEVHDLMNEGLHKLEDQGQ